MAKVMFLQVSIVTGGWVPPSPVWNRVPLDKTGGTPPPPPPKQAAVRNTGVKTYLIVPWVYVLKIQIFTLCKKCTRVKPLDLSIVFVIIGLDSAVQLGSNQKVIIMAMVV